MAPAYTNATSRRQSAARDVTGAHPTSTPSSGRLGQFGPSLLGDHRARVPAQGREFTSHRRRHAAPRWMPKAGPQPQVGQRPFGWAIALPTC
jgi:hypothetical protein